jgi:hypothetical protein
MRQEANVLSLQTLKDFKLVLCNFAEEARNSLSGVDMELRRTRDWLERDQLGYWQAQVKKRNEELMQARSDLHRKKISQQGSDAVSDAEQKEALREATRRLRVAEEKVALVRRLIPYLQHEIDEYHSHSQPLGDHLTGGFEKTLFVLGKMIESVESYLALKAPTAPQLGPVPETDSGPTSAGASTSDQSTTTTAESPNGATGAATTTAEPAATAARADEPMVSGRAS